MKSLSHKPRVKDLEALKVLIESGEVVPVIDRHYPFHAIADAMLYLKKGHHHGKVVLIMDHYGK